MPIARLAKKLNEELSLIDQKRMRLYQKYGEKQDNRIIVPSEGETYEKFTTELGELFGLEIEILTEKVKIPDSIIMPIKDLVVLEPFLEVVEVK